MYLYLTFLNLRKILRQELRTRYNLYKSYTRLYLISGKSTVSISRQSNGESYEKQFFKRDGYKCLLCGEKANTCHHLSYGAWIKFGDSKEN